MSFLRTFPLPLQAIGVLTLYNVFMSFAWYGHLNTWRPRPGMSPRW